uniref:RXYLT1 C-terminal domain-containing protein n=1 Tax=viral metagenome TaxID=1070528 RepID=A0A6C0I5J9_9ZZZZ
MNWIEEDIITTDKYLALEGPDIAYIKTDVVKLNHPIVWRGTSHTLRPAKTWITGHGDYGITSEVYNRYKSECERWFTINKECKAPNLFAVPLGITNDCDDSPIHKIYGNTLIMWEAVQEPRVIKNTVYMNFSIHTYPVLRKHVYTLFHKQPWVTVERSENTVEARKNFLQEIRSHKFVLCPRGNGVDTHRLWETLYMGSIPIVERHIALEEFQDLPICWISKWEEVTPSFLEAEYERITAKNWNLEKLKIGYWKDKIILLV